MRVSWLNDSKVLKSEYAWNKRFILFRSRSKRESMHVLEKKEESKSSNKEIGQNSLGFFSLKRKI